jgi:hypothetical protein
LIELEAGAQMLRQFAYYGYVTLTCAFELGEYGRILALFNDSRRVGRWRVVLRSSGRRRVGIQRARIKAPADMHRLCAENTL